MTGCLDDLDITMVEEGFTTKDLLETLLKEASQRPELALVKSAGVPVDRIICTGPCKQMSHIRYAASQGVQLMTFDNEVELGKVAKSHPSARMILSLATDESRSSGCPSVRFGATLKSCRQLLETAKDMNVEVVGVSFHIGSGCTDPQMFTQSIADARLVFEMGAELGYKMHLLDIGGGFPGAEEAKGRFEEATNVVNSALDLYFPEGCGVEIIAELGRYYVDSAFTFMINIVAKKEVPLDQPGSDDDDPGGKKSFVYHLNDGVYGSFSSVIFNNTCPVPILHKKLSPDSPLYSSSLWGPTGDGLDRIAEGMDLPELHVGDWLIFETMGAYTGPASSSLSGAQPSRIHYAMSRVAWQAVQLLQGKLLPPEEEDQECTCAPLSCGWEITDTLCVTPVFAPASIM
uniref:antizyme inhibitor 2 isoform X2 n=1 Tax=Euleptes europaea TaxID=460621 RepID=UPI002541A134|nr:antizyme inhibitor 2 isoform X2 [Euleptes europaea]